MDSVDESYRERMRLDAPVFPRNGKGQSIFLAELVGLPDDTAISESRRESLERRWETLGEQGYELQMERVRIQAELHHRDGKL